MQSMSKPSTDTTIKSFANSLAAPVYALVNNTFSSWAPKKSVEWLCTNMSLTVQRFKSFSKFQSAGLWSKSIVNLNVDYLESLGFPEDRCQALRSGLYLGLKCMPPLQSDDIKNYSTLDKYGDLVKKKLMKDVENDVIELFEPSLEDRSKLFFHPLGAVLKGYSISSPANVLNLPGLTVKYLIEHINS